MYKFHNNKLSISRIIKICGWINIILIILILILIILTITLLLMGERPPI